jgi:hypothetical protein
MAPNFEKIKKINDYKYTKLPGLVYRAQYHWNHAGLEASWYIKFIYDP